MTPKEPIWNFYRALNDKKKTSVSCLDCNAEVSATVLRLKLHHEKCPELIKHKSKPVKRSHDEINNSSMPTLPTEHRSQWTAYFQKPKLQQQSISSYGISSDANMWEQLDEQTAKLFYVCNLPFVIADHPVWCQTVGRDAPTWVSTSHRKEKDIGGPLLDKTHEKLTTTWKLSCRAKLSWCKMGGVISTTLQLLLPVNTLMAQPTSYQLLTAVPTRRRLLLHVCRSRCHSRSQGVVQLQSYGCGYWQWKEDGSDEAESERCWSRSVCIWLFLLGQDITPSQVIN